jgi:hypothetical protein
MRNDSQAPVPLGEDPIVDHWLTGVGRFSPRHDFEDRTISRVRVPIPRWLRALRDRLRGMVSGVTGWSLLATFSLATAAAWGSMMAAAIRYRGAVDDVGASLSLREGIVALRQWLNEQVLLPAARDLAAKWEWLTASGIPVRGLMIVYAIVVLVSAIALWQLMAEPAKSKGALDATQ